MEYRNVRRNTNAENQVREKQYRYIVVALETDTPLPIFHLPIDQYAEMDA